MSEGGSPGPSLEHPDADRAAANESSERTDRLHRAAAGSKLSP
jgi:hypothetical protein